MKDYITEVLLPMMGVMGLIFSLISLDIIDDRTDKLNEVIIELDKYEKFIISEEQEKIDSKLIKRIMEEMNEHN